MPEVAPAAKGVKLTVTVVLSPTFTPTFGGMAGVSVKTLLLDETAVTESVAVPVFLTRNCCWAVAPTFTSPKLMMALGDSVAWPRGTSDPKTETMGLLARLDPPQLVPVLKYM